MARSRKRLKAVYQDDISALAGGRNFVIPEQSSLANAAPASSIPDDNAAFELIT